MHRNEWQKSERQIKINRIHRLLQKNTHKLLLNRIASIMSGGCSELRVGEWIFELNACCCCRYIYAFIIFAALCTWWKDNRVTYLRMKQ